MFHHLDNIFKTKTMLIASYRTKRVASPQINVLTQNKLILQCLKRTLGWGHHHHHHHLSSMPVGV